MPTVPESAVTVRNRRFRFWKLPNRNRNARVFHGYGFGFGSEPAVFHGSEPLVFCGSGLVSQFSSGFLRFRHGFGSNFLNLNRTTVQKLTISVRVNFHGFGSEP